MTLVRGQVDQERAALVRLMDSMTRLFWRIRQPGIANLVRMINANSASWLTKILAILVRGQVGQERVARVWLMDSMMRLFWRIRQPGIANLVLTINANSVS